MKLEKNRKFEFGSINKDYQAGECSKGSCKDGRKKLVQQ